MTATLDDVTKNQAEQSAEQQAAVELVRMAKAQGLSLTGPGGLLRQLTKAVIETALNEEMTEHLGYGKHDPAGVGSWNIRNGTRGKTDPARRIPIELPNECRSIPSRANMGNLVAEVAARLRGEEAWTSRRSTVG